MAALLIHTSASINSAWLWLTVVCLALVPTLGWIAKSPIRRRFAIALSVVVLLSGSLAWAAYPPGDVWADCCQWLIPYGICWPIDWWGC